jgi:cytochrome c-type biogenesis protein CcmH/NrfF
LLMENKMVCHLNSKLRCMICVKHMITSSKASLSHN